MTRHCLVWKSVASKNIRGEDYQSTYPELVSIAYRGTLTEKILSMPRKKKISFEDAIRFVEGKSNEGENYWDAKKNGWFYRNFVEFVSQSGFHIELSGDEFVFHLASAEV